MQVTLELFTPLAAYMVQNNFVSMSHKGLWFYWNLSARQIDSVVTGDLAFGIGSVFGGRNHPQGKKNAIKIERKVLRFFVFVTINLFKVNQFWFVFKGCAYSVELNNIYPPPPLTSFA